ncbi:hypothetical protein [Flavobacterium sp. HSC-61S13]|uniref:hypothetical protein n=1 Tax=Flavobacterium sp. HSC-61S13 TaxID=2910963 RepID=UPI00209D7706|nr:hypothetical protein [Flavobacterium sp. HSC-61S13]MCP1995279.1 hypothetical protein [Flavobacterium sp. HSC-61S13]
MKTHILSAILCIIIASSCNSTDSDTTPPDTPKKVMLLFVDYTTHNFEGGIEITLSKPSETFKIKSVYKEPSDFGNIKLFYQEIDQLLFDGDIIWMGKGEITFPSPRLAAEDFERTLTADFITPKEGFESITINPNFEPIEHSRAWASVQSLLLARSYLQSNPSQKIKVFLYQPSAGDGDEQDWKFIFILKN